MIKHDFAPYAEAKEAFEGLMPKAIDELGGCGEAEANLPVYAQGHGMNALEVVDVEGLAEK